MQEQGQPAGANDGNARRAVGEIPAPRADKQGGINGRATTEGAPIHTTGGARRLLLQAPWVVLLDAGQAPWVVLLDACQLWVAGFLRHRNGASSSRSGYRSRSRARMHVCGIRSTPVRRRRQAPPAESLLIPAASGGPWGGRGFRAGPDREMPNPHPRLRLSRSSTTDRSSS